MYYFFCFFCLVTCLAAKPLEVEVSACSAILMNAETGAILYEKNAHLRSFPASTTKVATILYILDQKKPRFDQMVTVSPEALKMKPMKQVGDFPSYWGEFDGTRMGILKGEILSVDALLHGLIMASGNDAANALAVALSGSVPQFLDEMNQYLRDLGCQNTQLRNPHGLHHPEHYTSAYDLCLMAQKGLQIPKFREVVSCVSYARPKTNKQKAAEMRAANPLIRPGRKHYYPKAIGVKTGFHSNAKDALVAAAEHEGRTLIAVVLGCPPKTGDRYKDAIRLFEKAFSEVRETKRFFGPEQPFSREVPGAKTPLQAALKSELAISFYPSEEPQCKALLQWDDVQLPIRKGQKVGEVQICDEKGSVIKRGDLLAKEGVSGTFFFVLKEKINRIFH